MSTDASYLDGLLTLLGRTDSHDRAYVAAACDLLEEEGRHVERQVIEEVDGWQVRLIDGRPRVVGGQQLRLAYHLGHLGSRRIEQMERHLSACRIRVAPGVVQLAKGGELAMYARLPTDCDYLHVAGLDAYLGGLGECVVIEVERLPLLRARYDPIDVSWL